MQVQYKNLQYLKFIIPKTMYFRTVLDANIHPDDVQCNAVKIKYFANQNINRYRNSMVDAWGTDEIDNA